jgi:hypothetical protein
MRRKLFVAWLLLFDDLTPDREFLHDFFRFKHGIGHRIFRLFIITEVQRQLIRIIDTAF